MALTFAQRTQSARLKFLQAVRGFVGPLSDAERARALELYAAGWSVVVASVETKRARLP